MSLVGPWLNDLGNKKRKLKYSSAEAKKRDLELRANWEKLKNDLEKSAVPSFARSLKRPIQKLGPPPGRETRFIPSHGMGIGAASKKESPVYTGTKIIGIGTMHKSNAVPIFCDEDAKAISSMRR